MSELEMAEIKHLQTNLDACQERETSEHTVIHKRIDGIEEKLEMNTVKLTDKFQNLSDKINGLGVQGIIQLFIFLAVAAAGLIMYIFKP